MGPTRRDEAAVALVHLVNHAMMTDHQIGHAIIEQTIIHSGRPFLGLKKNLLSLHPFPSSQEENVDEVIEETVVSKKLTRELDYKPGNYFVFSKDNSEFEWRCF